MKKYLTVWGLLLALTAVEVVLAYLHTPLAIMLTLLIGFSLVKAGAIVAWFMHLAEEQRMLTWALMPAFFFIALLLLGILPDAGRAVETMTK